MRITGQGNRGLHYLLPYMRRARRIITGGNGGGDSGGGAEDPPGELDFSDTDDGGLLYWMGVSG